MSGDKDKVGSGALGGKPAIKTVVGVPVIPADRPSDSAPTHQLPAQRAEDELPTVMDMKAISKADADQVLSSRPPGVVGALAPRGTPAAAPVKTPPLAADMFPGLPRPGRPGESDPKTRAGVAPQPGVATKGRSTLLLDGSAPPVVPAAANDAPPIVVPAQGAMPPKAVTQPPPWTSGAASASPRVPPAGAPMRAPEPSVEEISVSMLLPPDASQETLSNAAEELSGSLLIEDAPGGGPPIVTTPRPPGSIQPTRTPSVKPPLPKGASVKPPIPSHPPPVPSHAPPVPSHAPAVPSHVPASPGLVAPAGSHVPVPAPSPAPAPAQMHTMLGMPQLPQATPPPSVPILEPPAAPAPPPEPPARFDADGLPMPPDFVTAGVPPLKPEPVSAPPPALPPTAATGADAPMHGLPAPLAPATGDVELNELPRSGFDRTLQKTREVTRDLGRRVARMLERLGPFWRERVVPAWNAHVVPAYRNLQTKLPPGTPKWFLPAVAGAGLLVGVGLVGLLVALFRGPEKDDRPRPSASTSTPVPSLSAAAATTSPAAVSAPAGAPCTVRGTPHVVGPNAVVGAGVEVSVSGGEVAIGFAPNDRDALGVRVDGVTLAAGAIARAHAKDPIRRVTPVFAHGAMSLVVDTDRSGDKLEGRRTVRGASTIQLGETADNHLAWARVGGPPAGTLWSLDTGASIDALRGSIDGSGDPTIALAFRSNGAIWMGTIAGTGGLASGGPLSHINGQGTTVGSPAVAISNSTVMVAWADRPSNDAAWKIRLARFGAGAAPDSATEFTPPPGGKGPPFMSPALAPVPGGRFLLVWSEGPASAHAVRAVTIAGDGSPLGAPLELSADGSNAGQPQAAVNDAGDGVVAFLESGVSGFEVAASSVACGRP